MGILLRSTLVLLGGLSVAAAAGACSSGDTDSSAVDPDSVDVASWSESVLGSNRMSFAGRHAGADSSGGSFYDVGPDWYDVTMACAGGETMSLEMLADGETISNGTTDCDNPATTAKIELGATAEEFTLRVSNSGEEMLWAVGLTPASEPSTPPSP